MSGNQKKSNWRIVIILFALIAVFGLAAYTEQKSEMAAEITHKGILKEVRLRGKWVAACHKLKDGTYVEDTVMFLKENGWARDQHVFLKKDCLMDDLEEIRSYTGRYHLAGMKRVVGQQRLYNINFSIQRAYETPVSMAAVRKFNESHLCHLNNWEPGIKRDITGLSCGSRTVRTATRVWDIMVKEHNQIYFGNPEISRGKNAHMRPKQIDKSVAFDFQF